ncbi:MAG: hypothetical protein CMM95_00900 [Rickettsiales bacterium]|nr:hypothetical protein [Rickettsiales bacterium]|tara:strand:+ start:1913 stop:2818 length:906 start_codon:yes stop_codon:yes gene_type:complete
MMPLKEKPVKSNDIKNLEDSKALNTEEILSLLSKTSNDFTRESDISENISNLFKKTSLKEMADSSLEEKEKNLEVNEKKDQEKLKDQATTKEMNNEKEENKLNEKKYTEAETKKIANDLAKDYYNKGYQLGIKKIKEELQTGEKALAINFKNALDNIFSTGPEFCEKLSKNINKSILDISREILGYEIDTKNEKYLEKINKLASSVEGSLKKVKIFLNKSDYKSIYEFISKNQIKIDFELLSDENLNRGDLKIKSGSIEIGEILSNKLRFSEENNVENEIVKIKNNEKNTVPKDSGVNIKK